MNSDKIEAGGINVSDLPHLEHLLKDLNLKADLIRAEYDVKVAEAEILSEEYKRTEIKCSYIQEKIEYMHTEFDTKQYNDGFKDVDPIGYSSAVYSEEGDISLKFRQFEPRDPIEADTSELGFTLDGDHHE